jgi:hypothetical protein
MPTLLIREIHNCKCNMELKAPWWQAGIVDYIEAACPYMDVLVGGRLCCRATGNVDDNGPEGLFKQCPLPKVQPNEDSPDS